MDSMIASAHVLSFMAADGGPVPDRWCHDLRTGSLTCRCGDDPTTFTWPAEDVTAIAEQARTQEISTVAEHFLARWEVVRRVVAADGLTPPDRIYVDHPRDEFTLVWLEPKLAVVISNEA